MSAALRLELRATRRLAAALVALHAVAGACAAIAVPGAWGAALGVALLALGAAAARHRALLRGARSVRAIEIDAAGQAALECADGRRIAVQAGARRFVSRYAVTLPVRGALRRTVLVTADMLDAERFRALRIWALWGRVPGVAAGQLPA